MSQPSMFRQEYTAQAKTIQRLAATRNDLFSYNRVDWEVAPSPDSVYAPRATDPPPGSPDDDLVPESACDVSIPAAIKPWRMDIVVDQHSLLEVKNWQGGGAVKQVTDQLNCYAAKNRVKLGLTFPNDAELRGWGTTYLDAGGSVWCAWGDPQAGAGDGMSISDRPATTASAPIRTDGRVARRRRGRTATLTRRMPSTKRSTC